MQERNFLRILKNDYFMFIQMQLYIFFIMKDEFNNLFETLKQSRKSQI